ncbi:MAG: NUDIX domain-containing protein [Patescibacteria group bacterium]
MTVRNPQRDIAVIKRKNFPVAYALPAGHCDGDSYAQAAVREAKEEIGIEILSQRKVFEGTFSNPCRRDSGDHHHWQVFETDEWRGTPAAGSDASELIWLPETGIVSLASRTWGLAKKYGFSALESHAYLVALLNADPEWQEGPGLELVWCIILTRIGMIRVPQS